MYYVMIEAVPTADTEEDCEGAFIDCWVDTDSEDDAIDQAKDYASSEGFETVDVKECRIVSRDDYIDEPESLEVFEEALEYGISGMIFTWPDEEE